MIIIHVSLTAFFEQRCMLASFQRCGNLPVENDLLKKKHRGDDKTLAHYLRMRGCQVQATCRYLNLFKIGNIFKFREAIAVL